ncbi:TRAF3-interacting JNK-activating modulator [Arvicola amphibius]|uniref:TRAF3-interacting JNK-activating modulator n=1 Tax=Arvicola amphibius TaxID=1047088 RepID=UPI0018E30275|nr:TRAF3-interacting JNK-activating modulator [Arvicola amphibius]XP_038205522.1 TRAF3-interacting JNK-activating modulator [Arvicola amphibius]
MISSDPKSSPGLARWAESYEAKCERRQETREIRRCRRNETTCRQPGKVLRTQHREQLQRARQLQFLRRRNLEDETKGQVREKGPSRKTDGRTGQVTVLKESLPGAKTAFPGQQVTGTSAAVFPTLYHSSSSLQRDLDGLHSSHMTVCPPQDSAVKKPHRQHRGTQTKAEEAQPRVKSDASQQTNCGVAVQDKDIIQLSEYLKEALQRELILKQKMVFLQDLLPALIRASDSSWKGQLNEDKLKGKLRSLENQLYTCMQKHTPWGMKKVLLEMEDQRSNYEQKAKESLQKVLEEKMSAERQLQSVQLSLAFAEQKCEEWRSQYEALKEDWRTLGEQHRELESQLHVLQSKLQGADSRGSQMSQALRLLEDEHQELQATIERLQGDREQQSSDTQDLLDRLKRSEEEKQVLVSRVQQLQSLLQKQSLHHQEQEKLLKKDQALPVWNPKLSLDEAKPESTGKEKDWELRDQLQKETSQLRAKEKECRELHAELDILNDKHHSCLGKPQHCQEAPSYSQEASPRRQCGQWLPVLMVVIATALAVFLANKDSLGI